MAPAFILLHVITNEKTLKLKQIDRLPALPRFPPQKHVLTTLVGIPVDIYTLVVPSPGVSVTVAESLRRDLIKICEWCDFSGMKLNVSKTQDLKSRMKQGASFFKWAVGECDLAHRRSVAVQDQVLPAAPSSWCSTCAACTGAGYTRAVIVHR